MESGHKIYFLTVTISWIAMVVYFGGEMNRATLNHTVQTVSGSGASRQVTIVKSTGSLRMYYDHFVQDGESVTTINSGSPSRRALEGAVNYNQCTERPFCKKCYSAGAGAVTCASFAFIALTFQFAMRMMVVYDKQEAIPSIGNDPTRFAFAERVLAWSVVVLYTLTLIIFGGACMGELGAEGDVVENVYPTGYIAIAFCLSSAVLSVVYLRKAHEETGFGTASSSGSGGSSSAAAKTDAPAVPRSAPPPRPTGENAV